MNRLPRKLSAAGVAGLLVSGVLGATLAPPASADNDTTLTVVGTSDVFDSHLVQDVLKPGFEAENPGVTLNYVSKGTGAAIDYAKAGTASALLVHAAALENQFVADGYSKEPYGRAIFWGDYVLLGPASDPAGVLNGGNATDDISAAFQKIAAAGAAGNADFVSRGGTPGTTVQEHAIWKTTTGVTTCTVPDASGGGTSPYNGTGTGCAVAGTYPSWYHATGLTQGPNITNGDACNYDNADGGASPDCYVFTDRGTFQYLQSTGQAQNLKIVTRSDPATTSAAKANLLVNSFHAYAINPDKFDASTAAGINTVLATKFLDYVTSPDGQAAVGAYLGQGNQPDPPFLPSAAPVITAGALPTSQPAGKALPIGGSVTNAVPGTPTLSNKPVELYGKAPGDDAPKLLKSTTIDANGQYKFSVSPSVTRDYSVRVPAITKNERPDLTPPFKDLLTAASKDLGTVAIGGGVVKTAATRSGRVLTVKGTLSPTVTGAAAHLDLYVKKAGATEFTLLTTKPLKAGDKTFNKSFTFTEPGAYKYHLTYVNDGVIAPTTSPDYGVTIP